MELTYVLGLLKPTKRKANIINKNIIETKRIRDSIAKKSRYMRLLNDLLNIAKKGETNEHYFKIGKYRKALQRL